MWLDRATSIARDAAILEGHAKGATQVEIAAQLGLTRQAVSLRAAKLHLQFRDPIDVDRARALVQEMTLKDAAKVLRCDEDTLRAHGVKPVFRTPPKHGRARYSHYGCRCDVCLKAVSDYGSERRKSGVAPSHGLSGYRNYGCRCEVCRAAGAAANREQAERRKQKALGVAEESR